MGGRGAGGAGGEVGLTQEHWIVYLVGAEQVILLQAQHHCE